MTLKDFLTGEKIYETALLPFDEAEITDERRRDRLLSGFDCKTIVAFLIPYYVKTEEKSNISRYAFSRDYHFYFKELYSRARAIFDGHIRAACDTSPINEVAMAVKAGLGDVGRNGLLLNNRYGSYAFVAEFFSDLPVTDPVFEGIPRRDKGRFCLGCGACERACKTGGVKDKTRCVSFINQKKRLDDGDERVIRESGLVWGCDLCQEACPLNKGAEESEIPFFRENLTPYLTEEVLDRLIREGDFDSRAYAWRGEGVVRRNARIYGGQSEGNLPEVKGNKE